MPDRPATCPILRSKRAFLVVLTVLLLGFRTLASKADDWPTWGGSLHDGVSQEAGFSDQWPTKGLTTQWTRQIGLGFSSISTSGNRLFATGHSDGSEIVWCLNCENGDVIWKHSYPGELIPNLHEGGPCSTPTIDGPRVYTLGKEGQFYCLNMEDGKVLWEKQLQKELGVKLPEWGFSSTPKILEDQLILETGRVVSFNKITGEKLWQSDIHAAGYGTAAVFDRDSRTLLATLDCDGLRITDANDGTQVAFTEWKSPYLTNATTPIVVNDTIFISTGYKVGCGLFRLSGTKLDLVYKNTDMKNHFNNSILHDGFLYGFDGDAHNGRNVTLNCINFETGKLQWRQRGLGCGSLLIVDGKLLVLAETGALVLANGSPDAYKELARSPLLEGRCWTVPTLSNGFVYARNADGKLVCTRLPRISGD